MTNESDLTQGFCTSDLKWCAIPYVNGKFIIINEGSQVHLCRSLRTAQTYIQNKKNDLCEFN